MPQKNVKHLFELPTEILYIILHFLSEGDLYMCAQTCKRLHIETLAHRPKSVWQLTQRHFGQSLSLMEYAKTFKLIKNEDLHVAAALAGNVEILEHYRQSGKFVMQTNAYRSIVTASAETGLICMFEWANLHYLCRNNPVQRLKHLHLSELLLHTAALNGHLEYLEYFYKLGVKFKGDLCGSAAAGKHMHVLKWLGTVCGNWGTALDAAALNGDKTMLQWLFDNGCRMEEYQHSLLPINIIFYGDCDTLKWLLGQGCILTEECMNIASRHGRIDFLNLLNELNCPLSINECLESALYAGRLPVLKWFHENGWPLTKQHSVEFCGIAGSFNHFEILRWLLDIKIKPAGNTLKCIIRKGDMEFAEYAISCGAPLSASACHAAAMYGRLDFLIWLRNEKNCPWTSHTCEAAASIGNLGIVQWAFRQGCPMTTTACRNALDHKHMEVAIWLISHGVPIGKYSWTLISTAFGAVEAKKLHDAWLHYKYLTK